ncbi:MAG: hypothetical protein LUE10_00025, partial [Alistipes sp.]|nr:hypothetical protein [Alistipes sp.]
LFDDSIIPAGDQTYYETKIIRPYALPTFQSGTSLHFTADRKNTGAGLRIIVKMKYIGPAAF